MASDTNNFYIPAGSTITVLTKTATGEFVELTMQASRTTRLQLTAIVEPGHVEDHPGFWYAEPDRFMGYEVEMTGRVDSITLMEVADD